MKENMLAPTKKAQRKRSAVERAEAIKDKIPERFNLYMDEVVDLLNVAESRTVNDILDAVIAAFRFGFLKGNHATAAGKVKRL